MLNLFILQCALKPSIFVTNIYETYKGLSPCIFKLSRSHPAASKSSAMATLPEKAAQCIVVFSSCKIIKQNCDRLFPASNLLYQYMATGNLPI